MARRLNVVAQSEIQCQVPASLEVIHDIRRVVVRNEARLIRSHGKRDARRGAEEKAGEGIAGQSALTLLFGRLSNAATSDPVSSGCSNVNSERTDASLRKFCMGEGA